MCRGRLHHWSQTLALTGVEHRQDTVLLSLIQQGSYTSQYGLLTKVPGMAERVETNADDGLLAEMCGPVTIITIAA